jgi:hypothetical protein
MPNGAFDAQVGFDTRIKPKGEWESSTLDAKVETASASNLRTFLLFVSFVEIRRACPFLIVKQAVNRDFHVPNVHGNNKQTSVHVHACAPKRIRL